MKEKCRWMPLDAKAKTKGKGSGHYRSVTWRGGFHADVAF
jgi:hypothetical protein